MSRYVPLRFNDAEDAVLQRLFAASDERALGTHIKRVYFDASQPNTNALQGVRLELEALRDLVSALQRDSRADPDLVLSLICGTYLMVRKSVGEGARAQADQSVDAAAVERYLRGR